MPFKNRRPAADQRLASTAGSLAGMRRLATARVGGLACACVLLVLGLIASAPGAQAAGFGIDAAGFSLTAPGGASTRQAGAHADFRTHISFVYDHETGLAYGNPKDVEAALPPGLLGNPTAAPTCSNEQLLGGEFFDRCPAASKVGEALVDLGPNLGVDAVGVYNMAHTSDVPGLFGMNVISVPIFIRPQVRPGDYGITAVSSRSSEGYAVYGADVTFWGVPADHGTGAPRRPFFSNATSCPDTATTTTISVDSWQNPGIFDVRSLTSDIDGAPFINEGCDKLRFEPTTTVTPGSHQAAAPTGLSVDFKVPQNEDPDGLATPQVRKTVLTLPKGVVINASSASGLGSCSPAEIGLGTDVAPTCPDSSKIGTVGVKTPLLEEELQGSVILAKQGDNPFNSLLALYLAIKGPGFWLKLPGKVESDPTTGQLTTTFSDTPQLPFSELSVNLDSGPRASLQAPEACGTFSSHVELTSWASPVPVSLDAPMTIDEGCGTGAFSPGLKAGVADPLAGRYAPFNLQVTRADGEQNLSRIEATLPEGELAKLAGVPLCPDAAAATGACPASSQVGATTVGAGAGTNPVYVPEPGKAPTAVYLAGPYEGAPYSLIVKVPAQAGPFDLGTVLVRNALSIDPITTQVTAKSDPLPQILQGIPISYRDVRVEINRPQFTLNPTSCDTMAVTSVLTSSAGKVASPSARFQAAGCGELAFAPELRVAVKGKTRRGAYQQLTATLTQPGGQANIGKVSVALPHSEFLAQNHINTVCTRVQFASGAGNGAGCPAGSIYGRAKAISPLLDRPLEGPVYLRSSSNPLPDLVVALHGQIDVNLSGRIDSVKGGIRTTFGAVPDAPVSKFVLTMKGGGKSLLVNSTNLCAAPNRATVKVDGQNAKTADQTPLVTNGCKSKAKRKRHQP